VLFLIRFADALPQKETKLAISQLNHPFPDWKRAGEPHAYYKSFATARRAARLAFVGIVV
jgi:hypothetical protein